MVIANEVLSMSIVITSSLCMHFVIVFILFIINCTEGVKC